MIPILILLTLAVQLLNIATKRDIDLTSGDEVGIGSSGLTQGVLYNNHTKHHCTFAPQLGNLTSITPYMAALTPVGARKFPTHFTTSLEGTAGERNKTNAGGTIRRHVVVNYMVPSMLIL